MHVNKTKINEESNRPSRRASPSPRTLSRAAAKGDDSSGDLRSSGIAVELSNQFH
jgi:hypothetical protein